MTEQPEQSEPQLTDEQKQQLAELMGYGQNTGEAKHNAHTFLHDVVKAIDTTKLGNLEPSEIGLAENPTRAYQFLKLFAKDIMGNESLSNYFAARSEIITATSLSKYALLIKLAVTQKRELADVTPKEKKENKGWFSKKDDKKDDSMPVT